MYKVYYLNNFVKSFYTRDEAMAYILRESNKLSRSYDDYEILDKSDFL